MVKKNKLLSLVGGTLLGLSSIASFAQDKVAVDKDVGMDCLIQTEYSLNKDKYGSTLDNTEAVEIEQNILDWLNDNSCIKNNEINYGKGVRVVSDDSGKISLNAHTNYSLNLDDLDFNNLPADAPKVIGLLGTTYDFCNDFVAQPQEVKKTETKKKKDNGGFFNRTYVGGSLGFSTEAGDSSTDDKIGGYVLAQVPIVGRLGLELGYALNQSSTTSTLTDKLLEEEQGASGRWYRLMESTKSQGESSKLGSASLTYAIPVSKSGWEVTPSAGVLLGKESAGSTSATYDVVADINNDQIIGGGNLPTNFGEDIPMTTSQTIEPLVGLNIGNKKVRFHVGASLGEEKTYNAGVLVNFSEVFK